MGLVLSIFVVGIVAGAVATPFIIDHFRNLNETERLEREMKEKLKEASTFIKLPCCDLVTTGEKYQHLISAKQWFNFVLDPQLVPAEYRKSLETLQTLDPIQNPICEVPIIRIRPTPFGGKLMEVYTPIMSLWRCKNVPSKEEAIISNENSIFLSGPFRLYKVSEAPLFSVEVDIVFDTLIQIKRPYKPELKPKTPIVLIGNHKDFILRGALSHEDSVKVNLPVIEFRDQGRPIFVIDPTIPITCKEQAMECGSVIESIKLLGGTVCIIVHITKLIDGFDGIVKQITLKGVDVLYLVQPGYPLGSPHIKLTKRYANKPDHEVTYLNWRDLLKDLDHDESEFYPINELQTQEFVEAFFVVVKSYSVSSYLSELRLVIDQMGRPTGPSRFARFTDKANELIKTLKSLDSSVLLPEIPTQITPKDGFEEKSNPGSTLYDVGSADDDPDDTITIDITYDQAKAIVDHRKATKKLRETSREITREISQLKDLSLKAHGKKRQAYILARFKSLELKASQANITIEYSPVFPEPQKFNPEIEYNSDSSSLYELSEQSDSSISDGEGTIREIKDKISRNNKVQSQRTYHGIIVSKQMHKFIQNHISSEHRDVPSDSNDWGFPNNWRSVLQNPGFWSGWTSSYSLRQLRTYMTYDIKQKVPPIPTTGVRYGLRANGHIVATPAS